MKGIELITLGFTLICFMSLPTYIGIKTNHPLIGILIGGISTISYLIYVGVKRK